MTSTPPLLNKLLQTAAPSGYEEPATAIWREAASFAELSGAYVENLGRLFLHESDLALRPLPPLLWAWGTSTSALRHRGAVDTISVEAAEAAIDREHVVVVSTSH